MSNITHQASATIPTASETVLLAEFTALRDEILLRIGIRGKITALTITAFGAIVALSANEMDRGLVLFVYPVFALFMAHEWSCHDMRIFEIATYIRNRIEGRLKHDGWEQYLEDLRDSPRHRMSTVAAWGMFMGSSILAPAIAAGATAPYLYISLTNW